MYPARLQGACLGIPGMQTQKKSGSKRPWAGENRLPSLEGVLNIRRPAGDRVGMWLIIYIPTDQCHNSGNLHGQRGMENSGNLFAHCLFLLKGATRG